MSFHPTEYTCSIIDPLHEAMFLRHNATFCVALPTYGLALAESERYLPELIAALGQRLTSHGLVEDDIVLRMTGCSNGCSQPYVAEIGLVAL